MISKYNHMTAVPHAYSKTETVLDATVFTRISAALD